MQGLPKLAYKLKANKEEIPRIYMFHASSKQAVMFPFEVRDPEDRKFFSPEVILAWAKQENYRIEVDNYDK